MGAETKMDLGFFTMPIHPTGQGLASIPAEDREAFLLADELGFTEAYVGEHVTDSGGEHHQLRDVHCLARFSDEKHPAGHRHGEHAQRATPPRSQHRLRCWITCWTGVSISAFRRAALPSDAEVFGNLDNDRGRDVP